MSLIALTDGPPGGPLSGSLIKIDQTASLSVIATGSGASAYGYNSSPSGAAFENDGVFNVAGVAYGQGIQLGRNQSSIHPDFLNTGQFTTSANVGWAVEGTGSLIYMNSGIVEADGGAQAIAFDLATPNSLTSLSNSGTITATASAGTSYGIRIDGGFYSPGQVMGIKNTGTITAQHAIAEITTNAISVLLTNSGAMNGDIVLQDGSSTLAGTSGSQIINTGSIGGAIHFNGNANDVYDGRGGTQTGGIYLGAGTDTAYLGNDGETVIGGSGGAAIIGGTGADTITGGSGADLIDGGGGADILAGGLGADEFLVRTATGSATITDFSHAQGDKIDLLALGTFFSLSDVLTHAARSGSDTVITLGSGTLTLKNILPEALTAQDFTFTNQGNSNTVLVNTYTRITGAHLISGPLGGFPAYNVISGAFISDAFILLQDVGRAVIGVTSIVGATFDAGSTLEVHATGFNNSNTATGYIGIGGYVGNSGVISAWGSAEADAVAIRLQGSNSTGANTVTNSGTISASADVSASAYGIQYSGPARGNVTQIFNSGTITAQHAISAQSSAASFPGQDPALRLTNSGTINGDIEMGYGPLAIANVTNLYDHQITNTGAINGAIHLSTNGNDYYDGRGGTLTGGLYLAGGDSTIYLGNDGETVYAGAGGVALITGGTGADTITTGAAADTIDGGGGNDVLTGGLGADTFVFSKASGQAAVTDFSDAQGDRIDLSSMLRFFSLGDILAASHQSGADAVIDLGSGASLTLRNVQLSGLADSDFILTPIKIHGGASLVIPAG
ncbi:MAG: beta strand repeat-containing protein, partial [Caulobacteraceae bacterium]